VADFVIGWHAHPVSGHPHLRLVHCKAMAGSNRSVPSWPGLAAGPTSAAAGVGRRGGWRP
jgi:hypothetical protein